MTEGVRTYEGLAVPLFGESEIKQQDITKDILTLTSYASNTSDFLVCQDSSGTEVFRIEDNGRIWKSTSAAAGDAMAIYHTMTATPTGGQQNYAATFLLDEATFAPGNGRNATLNVRFDAGASGNHAGQSFINFTDEGEKGTALFTLLAGAPDGGGCAEIISNPNSTIGLVIYVNNVKMWLLVSSAST